VSGSLFHRRRAERFAALLDESGPTRRHARTRSRPRPRSRSRPGAELADLVAVGERLQDVELAVRPDPEFRADLRAMLVATAEREGIGVSAGESEATVEIFLPRPRGRGQHAAARGTGGAPGWYAPTRARGARGAIVVGLVAAALAISGISAASGGAKPGDTLYGVKRSTEHAKLALAGSEVSRGQLYLDFARTRMTEALQVSGDPAGLAVVLGDMDSETRAGVKLLTTAAVDRHDAAALDAVDAFVAAQRTALRQLLLNVTGEARSRTFASLELLDAINRRTEALRPSLHCDSTGTVMDALGPRPVRCEAGSRPPGAGTSPSPDDQSSDSGPNGPGGQPATGPGGPSGGPVSTSPSAGSDPGNGHRRGRDEDLIGGIGRLVGGVFA
jgi:uncharacterized protein DUF5667